MLSDIDVALVEALDATGYYDKAYFSVPDGFALVTRLEQIEANGKSLQPPDRWSVQVKPLREFSLPAYLQALFSPPPVTTGSSLSSSPTCRLQRRVRP